MKLFEYTSEFKALIDLLENDCEYDEVTGEIIDNSEVISKMFGELTASFGEKLDSSAYIITELELQAQALKDEAKRLTARSKRLENNAEYLKGLMLMALLELPEQKLKTPKFTFATRKSESVLIEEGFSLFGKYVKVKEERTPDKAAIKEAIKAGEEIIGVSIVINKSLNIR